MFLVLELDGAYSTLVGRDNDSLRAGRCRVRIPVEARFSAPALGPTQAPTQRVPGLSRGLKKE